MLYSHKWVTIPEIASIALKTIEKNTENILNFSRLFSLVFLYIYSSSYLNFFFKRKDEYTHSQCFCGLPFNGSLPVWAIVSVACGCSAVEGCLETLLLQCKALQPLSIPPSPGLKDSGNLATGVFFLKSL